MKSKGLKILCLEDIEADAVIIRELLAREGLTDKFDHASNESEFTERLHSEAYDIILSDYNLPGFNGIAALLLAKKIYPDVPFICISGTIGEDLAVELMHLGASDYIMKDKLSKLCIAVKHALQEVEEHRSRIEAEKLLRESEARFRDIIMSSYDWVWEIDHTWKYSYSSDTIEKILGYTNAEIIGKSPFELMPPDERESVGQVFSEIAGRKGIIKDLENWNMHKDGHRVCLLTSGFPIFDESDNLTGYRGVDKDITTRKLAEEEIRKLSRAIEQSPVSVIITDLQGNITYANEAVNKYTGYSEKELIGENPGIFGSGETPGETYKILWETILSGKEWRGELLNRKKSGELYWESAAISPIVNEKGEMTHFLAIKEDITERKKLNSDLLEAKLKAESSDRLKTAFLNNISHEVRTPLNGILGFSEIIAQPDLPQEEKAAYLEILNESSERLLDTITNYMDISLIVSGNLSVRSRPFDLSPLLDRVYMKILHRGKGKNLEFIKQFSPDNEARLSTDEELLEKILIHLLDNSLKFTSSGSITLGWYYPDESEVELFVKDTGSGIDPKAQNSVFQIFMQEDLASTRGYEGSGLGLSIAKGLVDLMGGRIRMESRKGSGSSFFITFPLKEHTGSGKKSPGKTEAKSKITEAPVILIVEDDEANSCYLRTLLKKASLSNLLAFNGREAIEYCESHPEISLVLMDIKMPVMDGFEATRRIKEFRKNLPVIGLTAYALTGDREKALEAGCDDYLSKPVKSDLLLSAIHKQLGIRQL